MPEQAKQSKFAALSVRLWPDLAAAPEETRRQGLMLMAIVLINLPLALLSLVWLLALTDGRVLADQLPLAAYLLLLQILLDRQQYVIVIAFGKENRLPVTSSLGGLLRWSTVLILGPTAVWLVWISSLLRALGTGLVTFRRRGKSPIWTPLAALVQESGPSALILLIAAWVYEASGGSYPLAETEPAAWAPAIMASFFLVAAQLLLLLPTMLVIDRLAEAGDSRINMARFWGSVFLLMLVTIPFAIPLALTYGLGGAPLYVATSLGVLLANWLAHHLSRANLRAQARSRELARLEQLSAALLAAPADASTLPHILEEHLPLIFPTYLCKIRLFPARPDEQPPHWPIFQTSHPQNVPAVGEADWQQLRKADSRLLSWTDTPVADLFLQRWGMVGVKIMERESGDVQGTALLGGIMIRYPEGQSSDDVRLTALDLAEQLSLTLHRATTSFNNLARQRMAHELEFAWRIQSSFLPEKTPVVAGYGQVALRQRRAQSRLCHRRSGARTRPDRHSPGHVPGHEVGGARVDARAGRASVRLYGRGSGSTIGQ